MKGNYVASMRKLPRLNIRHCLFPSLKQICFLANLTERLSAGLIITAPSWKGSLQSWWKGFEQEGSEMTLSFQMELGIGHEDLGEANCSRNRASFLCAFALERGWFNLAFIVRQRPATLGFRVEQAKVAKRFVSIWSTFVIPTVGTGLLGQSCKGLGSAWGQLFLL